MKLLIFQVSKCWVYTCLLDDGYFNLKSKYYFKHVFVIVQESQVFNVCDHQKIVLSIICFRGSGIFMLLSIRHTENIAVSENVCVYLIILLSVVLLWNVKLKRDDCASVIHLNYTTFYYDVQNQSANKSIFCKSTTFRLIFHFFVALTINGIVIRAWNSLNTNHTFARYWEQWPSKKWDLS